ncbi:MAG: flavodoxin family protein [Christensenellaceae bacterium]|jgi:multimeric flavodoxin WrbA|nr:flavodoxin family protein [Christensenellaceae bacterium]
MKTLIINGSPRKNGNTSDLVKLLVENLGGESVEVSAYHNKITPCLDCRACNKTKGCAIKDDMQKLYDDIYDNVVVASPLYDEDLPGPMISIKNRFNYVYANKRFAKIKNERKKARGAIILVGGGDGKPGHAIENAKTILKRMNSKVLDEHIIKYLNTDELPALEDEQTVQRVKDLAHALQCI